MKQEEIIEPIKEESWESKVASSAVPVFVDFWAPWCGPCHTMEPIITSLAKEFSGKVKFVKANVDENPKLVSKLEIFSVPTYIVFAKGKSKGRFVGMATKEHVAGMIRSSIG